MALLILALLQRIFLMSSLMLLLVWLIFFMVLIKLLPILGTISGKTVKLMVLALICLGRSEERFSRNAETDLVFRLLLDKKNKDSAVLDRPLTSIRASLLALLLSLFALQLCTASLHT